MGDYNISQSIDLDQPMKGVHDIYDDYEVGFRTADDGGIISAQFDAVRISQNIESVQGRVGSVFTDSALKEVLIHYGSYNKVPCFLTLAYYFFYI